MKLKPNRIAALFIGIGILVVAVAGISFTIYQKLGEKSNLDSQLITAQTRLQGIKPEQLSSQPADLETQLNKITPEIEAVKTKLSQPVISSNATGSIFNAAKTLGLSVATVASSSSTNETLAEIPVSAMSLTATVHGNVSKIVKFTTALNDIFTTSAITSVQITVPEILNADNTTTSDIDNATANINLVVYTYRGE